MKIVTFLLAFWASLAFCVIEIDLKRYNDSSILQLVKKIIPEDPVIVEAGAHHGEDTCNMKHLWPKSTIFAFEPNPNSFSLTKERIKNLSDVYCFPLGLYDYSGSHVFYKCNLDDGASSFLESTEKRKSFYRDQAPIEINCITLDDFAEENNIEKVDFVWLDVEGAELNVFKGAKKVLENLDAVYLEVNFQEFRKGMTQYEDVKRFLEKAGFFQIYITPNIKLDVQANALFVKKALLKELNIRK